MLARRPEAELMTAAASAQAYAAADFSTPHSNIMRHFQRVFPVLPTTARAIDLGCGAADITIRLARAYPDWRIDALDGAQAMLNCAEQAIHNAGLKAHIGLIRSALPDPSLPARCYDVVTSNSLLHHLHQPQVLWQTIWQTAKPGAYIFIADLIRPQSEAAAAQMVEQYAADEAEVLRQDFYHSLLAAFTAEEIRTQLSAARLDLETEMISDRHLIVWGTLDRTAD